MTVSPKLAEWVIGVLVKLTAVTVTVYDPAGVDAEVGMERIDEPEREGVGGKNAGVMSCPSVAGAAVSDPVAVCRQGASQRALERA